MIVKIVKNAQGISYNNKSSGLDATNVQSAIDSLVSKVNNVSGEFANNLRVYKTDISGFIDNSNLYATLGSDDKTWLGSNINGVGKQTAVHYATSAGSASTATTANTLDGFTDIQNVDGGANKAYYLGFDGGANPVTCIPCVNMNVGYSGAMTVWKSDWSGRYSTASAMQAIMGASDGMVWLTSSIDGTWKPTAANYATSAGSAVDQTARNSAASASNAAAAANNLATSAANSAAAAQNTADSANSNADGRMPYGGGGFTGDVWMNNHIMWGANIIEAQNSIIRMRNTDHLSSENKQSTANMPIRCTVLHYTSLAGDSYRGCKENIKEYDEDRIKKILNVPLKVFDFRPGFGGDKKDVLGMIVDEVQDIIPEAVTIPDDWNEDEFDELLGDMGNKSIPNIDQLVFIPYLIGMVQILQKEINEIKK